MINMNKANVTATSEKKREIDSVVEPLTPAENKVVQNALVAEFGQKMVDFLRPTLPVIVDRETSLTKTLQGLKKGIKHGE